MVARELIHGADRKGKGREGESDGAAALGRTAPDQASLASAAQASDCSACNRAAISC